MGFAGNFPGNISNSNISGSYSFSNSPSQFYGVVCGSGGWTIITNYRVNVSVTIQNTTAGGVAGYGELNISNSQFYFNVSNSNAFGALLSYGGSSSAGSGYSVILINVQFNPSGLMCVQNGLY